MKEFAFSLALIFGAAVTPDVAPERSVVERLQGPEFPALGEPIVWECVESATDPAVAYDWRVLDGKATFVPTADGRAIHVWADPGRHRVECVRAINVPGNPKPVITRYDAAFTVGGKPAPDFAAEVRAAVPAEAKADLAALAGAMADLLVRDGKLTTPKIRTTDDLGRAWAELQKVYHGKDSPYGDKLGAFEKLAAKSLVAALGLAGPPRPVDAALRQAAVDWFANLKGILE